MGHPFIPFCAVGARHADGRWGAGMTGLTVDRDMIASFIDAVFRYVDDGTYVSLRAFYDRSENGSGRSGTWGGWRAQAFDLPLQNDLFQQVVFLPSPTEPFFHNREPKFPLLADSLLSRLPLPPMIVSISSPSVIGSVW